MLCMSNVWTVISVMRMMGMLRSLKQGFSLLAVRHADYTCCEQPLRGGAR